MHRRACRRAIRPVLAVLALLAVAVQSRVASAGPKELSVHLDPKVTACPDPATIRQRLLSSLGPRDDSNAATDVDIGISAHGRGYEATITLSGTMTGTRVIKHDKTSCDAMINAVAATLSLMFDPYESARRKDPEPPPPAPDEPEKAPPPAPQVLPSVALDVGAGITRGLLGNIAPVFGMTVRWLAPSPWSFGLGAFHQPFQRESALIGSEKAGSVGLTVSGAVTEGCFTALGDHASMALDVCANMRIAIASGTASGYPRNGDTSRPLVTLGPGVLWSQHFSFPESRVGWGLWARASADVPIVRASYDVDGLGIVYNGASTFFALSLGASLSLP